MKVGLCVCEGNKKLFGNDADMNICKKERNAVCQLLCYPQISQFFIKG